jgi:protein gp37
MSSRDWWDLTCDWWDTSWHPVAGCEYLTGECRRCFPPYWDKSHTHETETVHTGVIDINGKGRPFWNGELTVLPDGHHAWNFPLEYPGAENPKLGPGKPSLILVACAGDLFIGRRSPKVISRVVETIALSNHIGLFLSKYTGPQYRGQMAEFFLKQSPLTVEFWQRNVWLGFSAGRQKHFDIRWEHMRPLAEAGWFVYVSLAPLLEPVILPPDFLALGKRTWVIVNGEGEGAPKELCRPMDSMWVRAIRDPCAEAGIPFFLRGMARYEPRPTDFRAGTRQFPSVP